MNPKHLKINQRISVNLGSNQLIYILDDFLYEAVGYIFKFAPDFSLQWLCDMLFTICNTTRKRLFSVEITNKELEKLLRVAITAKYSERLDLVKRAALDRIFVVTFISTFLTIAHKSIPETYPELLPDERNLERRDAMLVLNMKQWSIEPTYNAVNLYNTLVYTFIAYIGEKYYKLSFQRTMAMAKNSGLNISKADLYSNNNLALIRAIYKYSPSKGTLTNFIQMWMRANNSPRFGHTYGTAYELPQSKRAALVESNWLDGNIAVNNMAVDLIAAENVTSDITGVSSTDKSGTDLELCYTSAAMLRYYPDVKVYVQYYGFPDFHETLIDHYTKDKKEIRESVKIMMDTELIDSPKSDGFTSFHEW